MQTSHRHVYLLMLIAIQYIYSLGPTQSDSFNDSILPAHGLVNMGLLTTIVTTCVDSVDEVINDSFVHISVTQLTFSLVPHGHTPTHARNKCLEFLLYMVVNRLVEHFVVSLFFSPLFFL